MSTMTHVDYVNLNGDAVAVDAKNPSWHAPKKREAKQAASWHKGFLVEGINEQMIAAAMYKRAQEIIAAENTNSNPAYASRPVKVPPPFSRKEFLRTGKRQPIQKKPFAIESSAQELKQLALKSGWVVASVRELESEVGV